MFSIAIATAIAIPMPIPTPYFHGAEVNLFLFSKDFQVSSTEGFFCNRSSGRRTFPTIPNISFSVFSVISVVIFCF